MSRSEDVRTSRRIRLRGCRQPITPDDGALEELAECFADDAEALGVDAIELTFDRGSAEEAIDTIERLVDAEYDVQVRELVVEIRR